MSVKITVPLSTPLLVYQGEVWTLDEENGCHYYYALRKDDPIFGDFLDSILVEEEEVNEIMLPQTIIDILDREWNDFIKVKKWMEEVKEPYITIAVALALGSDNEEPHKNHCNVTYDSVSTLSRIIRFPDGWERCVCMSEREKLLHVEVVGRQLLSLDCLGSYRVFTPHTNLNQTGINMQEAREEPTIAIIRRVVPSSTSAYMDNVKIALYGAFYLSVQSVSIKDRVTLPMDWNTALEVMKKLFVPHDSIVYSTIATLAGEGNYLNPTIDARWLTWANYSRPLPEYAASDEYLRDMYEASLSSFPEDVDPRDFGLIFDSQSPNEYPNTIARIVPSMHIRAIGAMGYYAMKVYGWTKWPIECLMEQKKEMWIECTVELMEEMIGMLGMQRILTCLNHAIDRGSNADDVATYKLYRDVIQKQTKELTARTITSLPDRISSHLHKLMKE